jgi:DNA-binding PadR family transcriptional regulator
VFFRKAQTIGDWSCRCGLHFDVAMEPKEIYLSLLRLHVLIEAASRPLDSAGVSAKLHDRGVKFGLASIRHILRRFGADGYLTAHPVRNSRPHKVYTRTAAGRTRAQEAKKRLRNLIDTLGSEKSRK